MLLDGPFFLSCLCLTAFPALGQATVSRSVLAMGTELRLEASAHDRATALGASEAAVAAVAATEARLSTWRADSELQRLNHAPAGVDFPLGALLTRELAATEQVWRDTEGAFDPGIGALVDIYSLRGGGRWPTPAEITAALAGSGLRWLELRGAKARRRCSSLRIEEGGFGKGAALDQALRAATEAGASAVFADFGGQVAVAGAPRRVAIADPRQRSTTVLEIDLEDGSLAVSGNSERGLLVDGRQLPHLLDPRTGEPAPERGSFVVLAPDALTADALSTGLYVAGWDMACRYVQQHPHCGVAQITGATGGRLVVRTAGALCARLRPVDARVSFATGAMPAANDISHPHENYER